MSDHYDPSVVQEMVRQLIHESGPTYITGISALCTAPSLVSSMSPLQTIHLLFWHLSSAVVERSIHYVYGCLTDNVRQMLYRVRNRDLILLDDVRNQVTHCVMVGFVAFCSRQRGLAITPILRQRTCRFNLIMVTALLTQEEPQQLLDVDVIDVFNVSGGTLHLNTFSLCGQNMQPLHPDPPSRSLREFYRRFAARRSRDSPSSSSSQQ